ncbi:MFS transporter [Pelagerythrobacter marensis]|uniref:MFS transporter n=1 Tax=Pelagerythrobacter marensis TaxID=543877 RepID=A0ABZ2D3Y8_9SPHN
MLSFLTRNARWLAGGLLLTLFSSFGQTFFIGLSGRYILEEFALTDGEFGMIYMICTLASAATLPWLGQLVDRLRGARMVLAVMPGLALACVLMAIAPVVPVLALAIYLLRLLGQGMMTHIALTEISRWFDANRGRAISLVVPGHQLGEAVLPILFAVVALASDWRFAWLVSAALILLAALPAIYLLIRVDRVPAEHDPVGYAPAQIQQWTRPEVLRDPVFHVMLAGVLAPAFIGTTIFFHQAHLTELRGYPPLAFAGAFPLMAGTTVVCGLVAGQLVDRFGAIRLLPFFLVPLTFATLAAASIEAPWGVYLFMVMFGVSYGMTSTMMGALWPEVYGTRHLGSVRAVVVAAMVFATALGPGLTGALIDRGIALPTQLYWMAGWSVAASYGLFLAARAVTDRRGSA